MDWRQDLCKAEIYHDLRQHDWGVVWRGIFRLFSWCLTCQQVNSEHQRSKGKSQRIPIPTWKWERILMYLIVGLSFIVSGYDSILVVVDRLTKSTYFIPVWVKYTTKKLVERFISQIMWFNNVQLLLSLINFPCSVPISWRHCSIVWLFG